MFTKYRYIVFVFTILFFTNCKKFLQIDPPNNQLISSTVFTNNATATSAISGLYSKMIDGAGFSSGGLGSIIHLGGLSADEFINYTALSDYAPFYVNSVTPTNIPLLSNLWGQPYNYIYQANSILEGLDNSKGVSTAVKNQISGEGKFIRAFCYFYLVNMFGDVPLVTSTNYQINAILSRTPKSQVYQQIITDLKDAQTLLTDNYISGSERVRPNKSAATALLARVYLYVGDYVNAELQATTVVNNTAQYSLLSNLNSVFLKNSSEAIWQLKPVTTNTNTKEGSLFIITAVPSYVTLSNQLYNSFELGDNRKTSWTHDTTILSNLYHYAFKYKIKANPILSEYSMILRLAEQYLIRAEARVQQNNIPGAQSDLNVIRNRAGLANTTANTQSALLDAILHERQVELFTEWAHRWLDLKRMEKIDAVMSTVTIQKGGTWNTNQQLYPIPQSEIDKNSGLSQNAGY